MDTEWPPKEIPEPPPHLLDRALEGSLVIFVGAGVSIQKGCPSWKEFAEGVLKHLAKNGNLNYGVLDQLKNLDPKKKLSIALEIAGGKENIDFKEILIPHREKKSSIYNHIKKIKCQYVTTNYDTYLHVSQPKLEIKGSEEEHSNEIIKAGKNYICRPDQFEKITFLKPGPTIHLHGCMDEPGSMIVSASEYLEHYTDKRVKDFLESLFKKNVVLFIGYGLEEMEILEQIFRVARMRSSEIERWFMLDGYFSYQKELFEHLKKHYKNSHGVSLIAYNKDKKGYDQIDLVVEEWAKIIKIGKPSKSKVADFLEDVANNE